MNYFKRSGVFAAVAAVVMSASIISVEAQKRKPVIKGKSTVKKVSAPNLYTLPSGTKLRVRMEDTISSKTAKVGDKFTATVTEPAYSSSGVIVAPAGSTVTGKVSSVKPAAKGGKPGQIDVAFTQINLPNSKSRAINGSLADLNSDDAKSDSEGTASGDKMKHRKVIFIGGGGAGGAVLGGAIGGGKGALIGAIVGAGAGFLGDRYTKGEEAEVKSGTEFGVYLNQSVALPRFTETSETPVQREETPSNEGRTYVVRSGDTLAKISQRFYGNTHDYMKIYDANRDKLSSPSDLVVGQELVIP